MKRINDNFLLYLGRLVPLESANVLEVGCGDGTRSAMLATKCGNLVGIDPNEAELEIAKQKAIPNAEFRLRSAENLDGFMSGKFDIVIFTLSFHHVPKGNMNRAIDEALRVTKPGGRIVFWEPGMNGSLFEAEMRFDAFDGDERQVKADARQAIYAHPHLQRISELYDRVSFAFDDLDDFVVSMTPKKNLEEIGSFLEEHRYVLEASRIYNVFQPV